MGTILQYLEVVLWNIAACTCRERVLRRVDRACEEEGDVRLLCLLSTTSTSSSARHTMYCIRDSLVSSSVCILIMVSIEHESIPAVYIK